MSAYQPTYRHFYNSHLFDSHDIFGLCMHDFQIFAEGVIRKRITDHMEIHLWKKQKMFSTMHYTLNNTSNATLLYSTISHFNQQIIFLKTEHV